MEGTAICNEMKTIIILLLSSCIRGIGNGHAILDLFTCGGAHCIETDGVVKCVKMTLLSFGIFDQQK